MKMIKYFIGLLVAGLFMLACTKQDDYKKFTEGGEVVYPARVDSIIVQPGNKRLQLRLVLGSDPSVNKAKVYWGNRQDSLVLDIVRTTANDTLNVLISNLTEGVYNFEVYTYDTKGNISVVRNATGAVYGDDYASTLTNRVVKSLVKAPTGNVVITWMAPLPGEKLIEMKYKDLNGLDKTVNVPGGQLVTEISDYQDETTLSYRTIFAPDSNAYDTYIMPYVEKKLPVFEREFLKSGFNELILPTDVREGGFGWLMPFLWNGVYTGNGFATQPNKPLPVWFTFDMGVSYRINRFMFWMPSDRIFAKESVKSFEIWGSNDPNPDGSWDSWTYLRTCVSIKPSGQPVPTNSAADVAAAAAGQEFIMPDGIPKTRYIRIKVLANWGNGPFQAIGELTFYSKDR
ncbi:MAG TPA: DUF4998 domain-containing protein [Pedobacter sp.]|uniref:DUF4998 domain-containing protein n=1 Tax=Pedobacter sp. TaxID=1411316 RepID=UPI002C12BE7C|nr:DUF4998 domain-containing protein [Pedobacter sp.]HMI03304.1 DUF4998 domain-containing protein [Pedobacter sp.]